MRKTFISIFIILLLILQSVSIASAESVVVESPNTKIIVNSVRVFFPSVPITVNGRTMLPYKELLMSLGISNDSDHIVWNSKERSLTVKTDETTIVFKLNSHYATVNNKRIYIDVAPLVYGDYVYIPLRFTCGALDKKVVWDGSTVAIFIADGERFNYIKSIIEECNNSMKAISYLKTLIDMRTKIAGNTGDYDYNLDIVSNGYSLYDATQAKSYTVMDNRFADEQVRTEEVYRDNTQYTKDTSTDVWAKKELAPEEFIRYLKAYTNIQLTENANDAFCAGLEINKVLTSGSTVVLSGNSFSDILFNQAGRKSEIMSGNYYMVDDFNMNLYIDITTNYIKKVTFNFKGIDQYYNMYFTYNTDMSMEFDSSVESFDITQPEGL